MNNMIYQECHDSYEYKLDNRKNQQKLQNVNKKETMKVIYEKPTCNYKRRC